MIRYGRYCTWWDTDHNAKGRATCPFCRGRLLVMERRDWQEGIEFGMKSDPFYEKFAAWVRGRCFPTFKQARVAYGEWRKYTGCKDGY